MFSRFLVQVSTCLIPILLLVSLSACGFQLRSTGVSGSITGPVYITAQANSKIAADLRRFLKGSDVEISEKLADAVLRVDIKSEKTLRRVLSIGTDTRVRDIELTYLIELTVGRAGDSEAISDEMEAIREYTYDTTGVLGSADEEELLLVEMRRDLLRRLLGRLVLLSREPS